MHRKISKQYQLPNSDRRSLFCMCSKMQRKITTITTTDYYDYDCDCDYDYDYYYYYYYYYYYNSMNDLQVVYAFLQEMQAFEGIVA